jgi:deferrochelatase/peroxidase EfeB
MLTRTSPKGLTSGALKDNIKDIQDNVVSPILLRYGRHIFVNFNDGAKARAWLRSMFKRVNARPKEHGTRFTVNIGFTYAGLKALGLSQRSLDSFPEAFRIGMRGRAHVVGDIGPHAPEHWEGGLGGPDIHAMGWIRTDSDEGREEATRIVRSEMEATGGVEICFVQDTMAIAHENGIGSEGEHFGFADPISQPPIEGAAAPAYPGDGVLEPDGSWRPLMPGEFVLGYEDEADTIGAQTPEPPELRLNGTFMVFRKLYQDVAAFRRYLVTAAKALYGCDDHYHQELVAAKIMGRWRSGCPVDLSPDRDDPAIAADPQRRNNFTYAGDDEGLRCPLGAHLRRSNPRATPLKRATR